MVKFINKYALLIIFVIFDSLFFALLINQSYGIVGVFINNKDDVAIGFYGFLTNKHIEIYDKNGDLKKAIKLDSDGGFIFNYEENILKVLDDKSSIRYNYDFNGNLLSEQPYEYQEYHDLMYSEQNEIIKNKRITIRGEEYLLTNKLGYAKLTKVFSNGDKKIIWETGVGNYIFKVICIIMIYIASLTVLIKIYPYFPRKNRKMPLT